MNNSDLISKILKISFDKWIREINISDNRKKFYTFLDNKQIYFTLRDRLYHPFFTVDNKDVFPVTGYSKEVEQLQDYLYGKQ